MTAAPIIAEIGTDMDVFATARRLAAWAWFAPGNYESAGNYESVGRPKGTGTCRGNVFLKSDLFPAA